MTDWDALEAEWRFGNLSNVALGKKHNVSEGAIRKRSKVEGWEKGIERAGPRQKPAPAREKPRPKAEKEDPAEAAKELPPMDMSLDVAKRLLAELDFYTAHLEDLQDDIYEDTKNDRSTQRRYAMLKAIDLGSRASTLKTIQQTLAAAEAGKVPDGKKEQRQAAAAEVAKQSGRFSTARAPLSLVKQ
jgi:hypothetical protein